MPTSGRRWRVIHSRSLSATISAATASSSFDDARSAGSRLADPGLGLDHLPQRPETRTLSVRQGPSLPPNDEPPGHLFDDLRELLDQPGLADPGRADHREQLRGGLAPRAMQGTAQHLHLGAATHQRNVIAAWLLGNDRPRLQREPRLQRLGLSLDLDLPRRLVQDRAGGRALGGRVHQHSVIGGRTLEPRGRVDGVTDPIDLAVAAPAD